MIEDEAPLAPGRVYLAASDRHLLLNGTLVCTDATSPVCAHRPSGTVLFRSMVRSMRGDAIGVLLTGMGTDGAEGLLALRCAGGYTIAEDESSAVVYGMPAAGVRVGAVCESLPLAGIAPRILELLDSAPRGLPCK